MSLDTFLLQSKLSGERESLFDQSLQRKWLDHMNRGHFRYSLESLQRRVLPGSHGFVLLMNEQRGKNRREPQTFNSVSQPPEDDQFNFCKIDLSLEGVMELLYDTHRDEAIKPSSRHIIAINISPLEYGNCLLMPDLEMQLPQVLTERSIALAMTTVLQSQAQGFKAVFNSLCANASVNHLHWHLFYCRYYQLKLERVRVTPVQGGCFMIPPDDEEYPAPAFAFQFSNTSAPLASVAANVFRLTNHLSQTDIAHNLLITRGLDFETPSRSYEALRIFVFVRSKALAPKTSSIAMAACELSGLITCFDESDFANLTEEDIAQEQQNVCRPMFDHVFDSVKILFD